MRVLRLGESLGSLLEGEALDSLCREVLPGDLPGRRWFAGKARGLDSLRVVDSAIVDAVGPGSPARSESALLLVEAKYGDGGADLYALPLSRASGPDARALAGIDGPSGRGILVDALTDDSACSDLLALIGSGHSLRTRAGGEVLGVPTAAFASAAGEDVGRLAVHRGEVEQSNSAVVFGDRLILKLFRRLEPGINPDFEIGRFLSERTTFDRIPVTAGALEYRRPDGRVATLAILQGLVKNEGTGWEHALAELGRYYDSASAALDEGDGPSPGSDRIANTYLDPARTLGRRTAEMHLALSSDPDDPAFAPEPLAPSDLSALIDEVREQAARALEALRSSLGRLPEPSATLARRVAEEAPGLVGGLESLLASEALATKIRCHGDYHLGQVLRVGDDFVILDFEGEPARPLEKRRGKASPIKDVVGMLRSFDYAAYAGLFAATRDRPDLFDRLAPRARAWQVAASAAFLEGYRSSAADAPFLPREPAAFVKLIQAYTLDKALYELLYELNNRPDWVGIPLHGIWSLVEQGRGRRSEV